MSPDQLHIRLLGPLEVSRGDVLQDLPPSKKSRALLAYLVASGRPQGRSSLCDLFFQRGHDPRAGLRWSLSKLRPVVDDGECRRIVSAGERVGFEAGGAYVDLHRVRALVGADLGAASVEVLRDAARTFRGEFLEGLDLPGCYEYEAWCLGMRERLRSLHVSIHGILASRSRHDPETALPHALTRLSLDPFSEAAYITVIEVLGELGRVERALELYERCRRMLSRRSGSSPSGELESARRRLGTSTRTTPSPAPPAEATPGERNRIQSLAAALADLPRPEGAPRGGGVDPPLVGRAAELAALEEVVANAGSDDPASVVLITGEPGIGKTRLLHEIVRSVRSAGGWTIYGKVFETEEIRPYGAWAEMLRELPSAVLGAESTAGLSGLLQGRSPDSRADRPTERTQLFDAVGRLLRRMAEARSPALVVLDDVQWLDASSAALLHYLARTVEPAPLVFALAAREEEIEAGSSMARVIRSLDEAGHLRRVPLRRLDAAEIGALVRTVDDAVDPDPVFTTSEGNPLFALAIAASLREGIGTTPGTVEEELRHRLERLEPGALSLLPWAASLGREFDVPTLVQVVDRPTHEVVDAIDGLERRGILRTAGADRYDFTHSLLRQAAYRRPSEPVRRAIHRSIARALDASVREAERAPGAIAHHAERGGLPRLSAEACTEAAEASLWVFAYDEAAEFVERGLAQVRELADEIRVPLEMGLLRIHSFRTMRGWRPAGMEERVEQLTAEARELGLTEVIAVGHALLMELQYQRGAFEEAGQSSERMAEVGRRGGPETAIWALAETGACLLLLDRAPEDARRLTSEASLLAERNGVEMDVVALARALLHYHDGELEPASEAFEEVIRLGRRAKDRWWQCSAMTRSTMVDLDRGDTEAALSRSREAEQLAERMGDQEEAAFARALGAVAAAMHGPRVGRTDGDVASEDTGSRLEAVDDALRELRELDSLWMIGHIQAYAAEVELELGRAAGAGERATEALAAARTLRRPSLLAIARGLLARSAALEGSRDGVARHLESAEVIRPHHHLSHRARRVVQRAREAASR
jgi:DNA-binding SARP family transcriptional activator/tetratricopeptide (TPR) repeat protein/KaiC/GvpD/RAD55 family RecA-like ATPase